jgi:hypothetical protein
MHLLCIFVFFVFVWISLLSKFFLHRCVLDFSLMLASFAFGNTPTCALSHSDKDHEKISSLK